MQTTCDQLKTNLRQIYNHFSKVVHRMIGGIKEFHIDIGRLISARLIKRRINSLLFSDNTHVYRVVLLICRIV